MCITFIVITGGLMSEEIKLMASDFSGMSEAKHYVNMSCAYIKKEELNNMVVWGIYNFDGEKMGFAGSRDTALAIAKQNKLVGISVH